LLVMLVLLVGLSACFAGAQANNVRIRHSFFGMHDGSMLSMGPLGVGSVRLWDAGVTWQQIEQTPGHYTWGPLDTLVSQAQAAHVSVTMVVAMTPTFYNTAHDPRKPPTDLAHYKAFVSALMHRYKNFHGQRGIASYQSWNEPNITTFWTGSMGKLAKLGQILRQVRNRVDPGATVVAPPMVTRLPFEQKWMKRYFATKLHGTPVWRLYDVLALSLYPLPTYNGRIGTPEDTIGLLHQVKRKLHHDGVPRSKPIWNTEVNYGSDAGQAVPLLSNARQAAFVMRTYLLNAANGVKRVFWYRYDMGELAGGGTLVNTLLSQPSDHTQVTPAGHAYALVQKWMHGTLLGTRKHAPCPTDRNGTYTCVVKDSSGTRRIYWNPFRKATVRLVPSARHLQGELGGTSNVNGGHKLTVDYRPVMVSK
jgi:hypothetical protein